MTNEPIVFRFKNLEAPNIIFLDRDGVLNEAVHRGPEVSSPRNIKELKLSGDISALASHNILKDWSLVIITNQPDLSRGLIDLNLVEEINNRIISIVPINEIYICPHQRTENCNCRKPKIGLFEQFCSYHLKAKGAKIMVGDSESDLEFSIKAKIPFILRKRCYNADLRYSCKFVINDLWEIKNLLSDSRISIF